MSAGGAGARRPEPQAGPSEVVRFEGECRRAAPPPPVCPDEELAISALGLARLMPMFLWLDAGGKIRGAGPTLAKILGGGGLVGADFFDMFEIRRPRGITGTEQLSAQAGARLQLRLHRGARTAFRGLAMPLAGGAGLLINLSFGISVADAVRDHGLTDADFAPTDLTIELLYLAEAKAVVMGELHDLARRLQRAKVDAEAEALTDMLTGLSNRRGFDNVLGALLRGGRPFSLMHVDLDYFKQVNDTYGHAAGDHVLRRVAQRLRGETRGNDMIARIGGDEFVLLFPGLDQPDCLSGIAERIIARLSQPIDYAGTPCRISASVGFTLSASYAEPSAERMLADADAALYASKKAGRHIWTQWTPDLSRET